MTDDISIPDSLNEHSEIYLLAIGQSIEQTLSDIADIFRERGINLVAKDIISFLE